MPVLDITKQTVEQAKAKLAEQPAEAQNEAKQKGRPKKEVEQEAPQAEQPKA